MATHSSIDERTKNIIMINEHSAAHWTADVLNVDHYHSLTEGLTNYTCDIDMSEEKSRLPNVLSMFEKVE
jgi:hypothetical protein